jgi:hypothetical protein
LVEASLLKAIYFSASAAWASVFLAQRLFSRSVSSECGRTNSFVFCAFPKGENVGDITRKINIFRIFKGKFSFEMLVARGIDVILTYLPTPCGTVLLEKLTGYQPVKKFPTFYGTRRFITAFTSARHLSLS